MSINWEKGLKRIWWVFAAVWWLVGLVVFIFLYNGSSRLFYTKVYWDERFYHWITDWISIFLYFLIVGLFPLIVSYGVKFVKWIIEGFKEDKTPIIEEKDSTEDKE